MSLITFSDSGLAAQLLGSIRSVAKRCGNVTIMEVCGTHTMEIGRIGLRPLLPPNVRLVSGPGCPVCVTPGAVIDAACRCALKQGAVILSFGDMLRVPGSEISFQKAKAAGADIRIVTSPLQGLTMAQTEPSKVFIAVAVGFETTIPSVARAVLLAHERNLGNFKFLIAHRLVPPALDVLVNDPDLEINAFLLPGHVSAIIGERAYCRLETAGVAGVIAGFEPLDILGGILAALEMVAQKKVGVANLYPRVVRSEGNPRAVRLIGEVFEKVDAIWRGIGSVPASGLALRRKYAALDAGPLCPVRLSEADMPHGCSCGRVLKGIIRPDQCPLFGAVCTPASPVGPCMVSSEGSCAAYHRYGG